MATIDGECACVPNESCISRVDKENDKAESRYKAVNDKLRTSEEGA